MSELFSEPSVSKIFLVPDVHGNLDALRAFLVDAEIIDDEGSRIANDVKVISVGDLANCVRDSLRPGSRMYEYDSEKDDLDCLDKVGTWIDLLLVGNHEYPHWGGPAFHGYFPHDKTNDRLLQLEREGCVALATSHEDILITHAGLSVLHGSALGDPDTAEEAAARIQAKWSENSTASIFSDIGESRGGWEKFGGILWSDCAEQKYSKFRQIFGHTPGPEVRVSGQIPSYCIDLGGGKLQMPWGRRLAGAFLENGDVDILEVDL